jgi:site-specific DNA recombinase
MARAAIYCRISRADDDDTTGVERQLAHGQTHFRHKGIQDPDIYPDNDVSASAFSTKARPQYLRLLEQIDAGTYDGGHIWMWAEDRTHRQIIELWDFIKRCRDHNITVATAGTEYDLADEDQLTMWMFKVRMAEAEVAKTSKRLRDQRLAVAEAGYAHPNGERHFGFQHWVKDPTKPKGSTMEGTRVRTDIILAERAHIREAVQRLLDGDSVRFIVQDWTARNITTTRGTPWSRFGFRRMITSPAIAGYRDHRGTLHEAAWAPIVDPADWQAVRDLLADPARKTTTGRGPKYLLTGLIYCGSCNQRMRARNHKQNGVRYYMCDYSNPKDCPQRLARMVTLVDQDVTDRVIHALVELPKHQPTDEPEDPTRVIYDELARLQARLDRLDDDETTAQADGDTRKLKSIRRVKVATEREATARRDQLAKVTGNRVRAHAPANLAEVWPDLSLDRRRALVAAVVARVVVLPLKVKGSTIFDPAAIRVEWLA